MGKIIQSIWAGIKRYNDRKFQESIFIFLCMGFVFVMAVCTIFRFDGKEELYGTSVKASYPEISMEEIWKGKYQSQWDEWYKDNLPFHTFFVKLNNQILYSMGANINDIIVGKDGWLYSEEYVNNYYSNISDSDKIKYSEYILKIGQLKEKLERAGKQLIYIITPSKAEACPEFIPVRYKILGKSADGFQNNYDYLKNGLSSKGIPFIDMVSILKEQKGDTPFFSKTGIHWNYYATAFCAKELVETVDDNASVEFDVLFDEKPYGTEQDIYLLANIFSGIVDDLYYRPDLLYSKVENLKYKKVLEMGTSFSNELVDTFGNNGAIIWNKFIRYQYFVSKYISKGSNWTGYDGSLNEEQLEAEVGDADIIIIENNNSYIPESHYIFVDFVLNLPEDKLICKDYVDLDKEDINIDFSNGGNSLDYVRKGCYPAEAWGSWGSNEIEISVDLGTTKNLSIDLSFNTYFEDTVIMFNDQIVWRATDGTEALKRVFIPYELVNNKAANIIKIVTDKQLFSPKEMGLSEDTRILAHKMIKLSISNMDE